MNDFRSKSIRNLEPYIPGEQPKVEGLIKLNTNESPYPPSPSVLAAIREATNDSLRLYPDPEGDELKQAISEYYAIDKSMIFLGNGSDEILAHIFFALLKHEHPLLFPDISYSFYPVYCRLYGIDYIPIPLDLGFRIDPGDYMRPNGGIIFPNPNAPTGIAVNHESIQALLEGSPDSVVVVDEAYVDFGAETAIPLINRYPNLLVVQTLSKSRSLAGLRIGFALGQAPLIEALRCVKDSFNSYPLDRLALAGASAALRDRDHFDSSRRSVIKNREQLTNELESLGFMVLPSKANFIFARHAERDGKTLLAELRSRNILVRHFDGERTKDFLRISIGSSEQCRILIDTLRELL